MPYFAVMATAMGLQQLKAWQDNKQKDVFAAKQKELREALQNREFDRVRQLHAETHRISMEMEKAAHEQRRQDIENEYDSVFEQLADQLHLEKWPLNVVPFIMKGESFGSRIRGFDVASVHCVLTPSNNLDFNRWIYSRLDMSIELMMNLNWNSSSDHSVVYYGASWKPKTNLGIPKFDNNDILRLYADLRNVPFICITPYFKETTGQFYFKVRIWGMGADEDTNTREIYPPNDLMENCLTSDSPFSEISEETIPQMTNYIVSMIGYLTDMYYWKMYNASPILPMLIKSNKPLFITGLMGEYCESIENGNATISDILKYGLSLIRNTTSDREDILKSIVENVSKQIGLKTDKSLTLSDLISQGNLMMWLNEAEKELLNQYFNIDYSTIILKHKNNNLIKMNAEQYSHNKAVLLDILSDILKIEMLPKSHRTDFVQISKKIQEDQFSIVLIGEFQGGKSTTFDALCDGREISPRGNNIKTSACRIRVTNIADDSDERATVIWKSDTELIQTISSILTAIPPTEFGYNPDSKDMFSYAEYVNLSNPKHRAIIEEAIDELSSGTIDRDTRDIIMVARFILANYENVRDQREEKQYTFKEAMKYMVFPKDMVERYNKSGNKVSCFTFEESLFAFVQTVDCYIHSKSLERLGCSFVDCPGLFASDYDTSIAIQTMSASDATLYLLGGEKQMGQEDKKSIGEIFRIGKSGNKAYEGDDVFFVINQRKPDSETSFVNLDLSEIEQAGFKKNNLPLYNAILYYYAQLGKSYLDGSLDDETYKRFMSEARPNQDFAKRWIAEVKRQLVSLRLDEDCDIDVYNLTLSYETISLLRKYSKADSLFSSIEDYIVGKKSYSILIDNGALKVQNGLSSIEVSLREKEKSAQMDVAEKAREFEQAREAYQNYRDEVESTLESAFPDKYSRNYIEDTYRDYFLDESVISDVAFKTTVSLIDYMKKGSTKWRGFKLLATKSFSDKKKKEYEAQFASEIKVFLTEAFRTSITPVITRWVTSLYAGNDLRFDNTVRERAMELGEKIQENWKQLSSTVPLFHELSLPNIEEQIPQCVNHDVTFDDNDISSDIIRTTSEMAVNDAMIEIIAQIVSYVSAIVVMVIVDMFVTFGLALIIGLISEILVYIGIRNPREINSVADFKKKELALYNELKDKIRTALSDNKTREPVCFNPEKGMIKVVDNIIDGYKTFYLGELDSKRLELENVISEQEQLYNGTRQNLERIAAEAKKVRENEIQPLLSKVTSFIKNVTNEQ